MIRFLCLLVIVVPLVGCMSERDELLEERQGIERLREEMFGHANRYPPGARWEQEVVDAAGRMGNRLDEIDQRVAEIDRNPR